MNRILSAVFVTAGVILLVWILVVSLWPRHQVEIPKPAAKVVATTAGVGLERPTGAESGVPTLAPQRPMLPEAEHDAARSVTYVTIEVEFAGTAAQ